ncbi:MAG: family acetyltransferase [Gammaproteobacteria bacterium]|jgi:phosphinothricin acetyltransferase|nr:family acetyltransferase [Gammaproteobacteria bacterium]HEV7442393.1 GNAT family N-acetyltransferase [Steroidobacteraceae bacterium]
MLIRDATNADLPAILAIYNDVVTNTTAIYDQRPSTLDERQSWFDARGRAGLPVLVAELDREVVGFSSFGEWRSRWGYRYTVEHSVHVRADCRGRGFGRALIEVLFPRAAALGMHMMIGHIDSAATASLRLHEKLGFTTIGTLREVAQLHNRWLSVVAVQREI